MQSRLMRMPSVIASSTSLSVFGTGPNRENCGGYNLLGGVLSLGEQLAYLGNMAG